MYVLAKELDPTACCIPKVGIAMKASILEVSALRAPAGVVAYGVGEAGVALFYHLSMEPLLFIVPRASIVSSNYNSSISIILVLQTYTYTTLGYTGLLRRQLYKL